VPNALQYPDVGDSAITPNVQQKNPNLEKPITPRVHEISRPLGMKDERAQLLS
jgi:hypothetical protein